MYANLLTKCDDACVITPYLFIYLFMIEVMLQYTVVPKSSYQIMHWWANIPNLFA